MNNDGKDISKIPIKEFREKGYLQELNRQFLHPLGLALEVIVDEETGKEKLGGIWDYRNDPEGILYNDKILNNEDNFNRAKKIQEEFRKKIQYRKEKYGFHIQPYNIDKAEE
jgi:hypothetical protein